MDWTAVRDALLSKQPVAPTELAAVPEAGVYAWWDLNGSIPYPAGFPAVDPARPLYIGLAARAGLNVRGMKMHLKTTRMSGLRRSLASLLVDELDLLPGVTASPGMKMSLDKPQEALLTSWMLEHLLVTWVTHPTPDDVEAQIIGDVLPPLNGDFAHRGPYWHHVAQLRAKLHGRAVAAGQTHGI